LVDVEAIVCGTGAKFLEVNVFAFIVFDGADLVEDFVGEFGIGGSNTEVVDLAAEENLVALVGHLVDVALVGGGFEAHFGQDAIDVSFPEGTSFGVALESVTNGEDHGSVELDTVTFEIPFGIGIVDQYIGRDAGCGGVSIGVTSISSKDLHVEGGGEGHEEAHAGVLNAGRVGAGESMEFRGSTFGSVAAVAGTTSAIGFDFVHPMLAEDDGTRGTRARFTVHFKFGKTIELFTFGTFPDGPGVQIAKFAASERAKSTFGRAASSRGEGVKK
jgi:hypothetical protein